MRRLDIEPDEDGNDFPPPMAVDESHEVTHPSGQDEYSQIETNTRTITAKVYKSYFVQYKQRSKISFSFERCLYM